MSEGSRLGSLIRQLQGALGGNRFVRGTVLGATGGIVTGTGFTVNHTATGRYTITFDQAFGGIPTPVAWLGETTGGRSIKQTTGSAVSATQFQVSTIDSGGAAADLDFHFIAIGPA